MNELQAALYKYGDHRVGCYAHRSQQTGIVRGGFRDLKDPDSYTEDCTCGFEEALHLCLTSTN